MRDSARSAIRDRPSTAEIRQPLGYAMVGGLIVSQVLTLFTTPVIYLYMDRLRGLLAGRAPGAGATVGELPENSPISS